MQPFRLALTASPRVQDRQQDAAPGSYEPWLGKANRLDGQGKLVIEQLVHRIITEKTPTMGEVLLKPKIKYRTKYESADK